MTARSTAGPAIRVQGLEKSYGRLEVLRGVDFDVAPGTVFAPARLQRVGQDHDRADVRLTSSLRWSPT
jgi:ABC-type phosphonate transport system ATPase subunit